MCNRACTDNETTCTTLESQYLTVNPLHAYHSVIISQIRLQSFHCVVKVKMHDYTLGMHRQSVYNEKVDILRLVVN